MGGIPSELPPFSMIDGQSWPNYCVHCESRAILKTIYVRSGSKDGWPSKWVVAKCEHCTFPSLWNEVSPKGVDSRNVYPTPSSARTRDDLLGSKSADAGLTRVYGDYLEGTVAESAGANNAAACMYRRSVAALAIHFGAGTDDPFAKLRDKLIDAAGLSKARWSAALDKILSTGHRGAHPNSVGATEDGATPEHVRWMRGMIEGLFLDAVKIQDDIDKYVPPKKG